MFTVYSLRAGESPVFVTRFEWVARVVARVTWWTRRVTGTAWDYLPTAEYNSF
jgi:hypothetical protein